MLQNTANFDAMAFVIRKLRGATRKFQLTTIGTIITMTSHMVLITMGAHMADKKSKKVSLQNQLRAGRNRKKTHEFAPGKQIIRGK